MTDLTKASEALLAEVHGTSMALTVFPARLAAIEAAVRSDTLADVAARLPEALWALPKDIIDQVGWMHGGPQDRSVREVAAAILANLTGGTR